MTTLRSPRRRARTGPGGGTAIVVLIGCALTALTGCTSTASPSPDASAVVSSLGAVPIPSSSGADPTPTASVTKLAVLAMGAPVLAVLPDGSRAVVTATGPDQTITVPTSTVAGVEEQTPATITVTVRAQSGTPSLSAADLVCRDDTGSVITLQPVGAAKVAPTSGTAAAVEVSGTFRSGAAQITWQPAGTPLAVWDFNIELD